jgi:hypothetical protein
MQGQDGVDGIATCATAEICSPPPIPMFSPTRCTALQGGLLLAQTLRRAEPLRDSPQAAVAHLETFAATPLSPGD